MSVVDVDSLELTVQFLHHVWVGKGYIDLPTKVNGHWNSWTHEWPASEGVIRRRVSSALEDDEDLYFSVCMFREDRRSEEVALATKWLWADLDEVSPGRCIEQGVCPTLAWESSPGRYQALWELDKKLPSWLQTQFNQALSTYVGADIGGWDITQVLRPPGAINYKYSEPHEVELLWANGPLYRVKDMAKILKSGAGLELRGRESRAPAAALGGEGGGRPLPAFSDLPPRARRLLRAREVVIGERSDRRWELECLLAEAGLTEDQIFALVWDSEWNAWRTVRTGASRLRREVKKAIAKAQRKEVMISRQTEQHLADRSAAGQNGKVSHDRLGIEEDKTNAQWMDYDRFMALNLDSPPWLIEGIWSAHSHGIIGGEPKTAKSTLALAMGLSVASGRPFLGEFPVVTTGPVLMVQEENAPWVVKDRLSKIAASYGLIKAQVERTPRTASGKRTELLEFPESVPMRLLNNWGFDLSDAEHREMLEAEVAELRPAMVILDPLYLMIAGANDNYSHEVRPFLRWLLYLRYTYSCAVVVVHHMGKMSENQKGRRFGQRLAGSHIFHGWIESGLYAEAKNLEEMDGPLELTLRREFRNVGPRGALQLTLDVGEPGDLKFEARFNTWQDPLAAALKVAGENGVLLAEVAKLMRCDRRTAKKRASAAGFAVEKRKGVSWRVYEK